MLNAGGRSRTPVAPNQPPSLRGAFFSAEAIHVLHYIEYFAVDLDRRAALAMTLGGME